MNRRLPTSEERFEEASSDERERVEAEWLLARTQDPATPAPSLQVAQAYEELEELIGTLPEAAADEGWHASLLDALPDDDDAAASAPVSQVTPTKPAALSVDARPQQKRAPQRNRWVWPGGIFAVAAALALFVVVSGRHQEKPAPEVAFRFDRVGEKVAVRGNGETASVGESGLASSPPGFKGELRVFRGDIVEAVCRTGDPNCTARDGSLQLKLPFSEPKKYTAVLIPSNLRIDPETNLDDLLGQAPGVETKSIWVR